MRQVYTFVADTTDELIIEMKKFIEDNEILFNKMQKHIYGDRLNSLPREQKQKIISEYRGTGNTTRQALKQIIEAGENPNVPIRLKHDHAGADGFSYGMRGGYLCLVQNLIDKLEFKFYELNRSTGTLTFKI